MDPLHTSAKQELKADSSPRRSTQTTKGIQNMDPPDKPRHKHHVAGGVRLSTH